MSLRRQRLNVTDDITGPGPQTYEPEETLGPPDEPNPVEDALVLLIHNISQVNHAQAAVLAQAIEGAYPDLVGSSADAVVYGPNFDLTHEVNTQLAIVNSMRHAMIDPRTQTLRENFSTRDAKELITASNTLMGTLTKAHKDIINTERQRAVEEAVIKYASQLEEEEKQKFLTGLEEELGKLA